LAKNQPNVFVNASKILKTCFGCQVHHDCRMR